MVDMTTRPQWAQRIVSERKARNMTQRGLAEALRVNAENPPDGVKKQSLPELDSVLRRVKDWESGRATPDRFYRELIARTFGTVTHAFFPEFALESGGDSELDDNANTLTIINRLRRSDVDNATLEGLAITFDRLASDYSSTPGSTLLIEARQWLRRVAELRNGSLSLAHHREAQVLAGWLALLVGCIEYDLGDVRAAESTRQAAYNLAAEAENAEIMGWAQEMRAWFSLTGGDLRGTIAAARAGADMASSHGVAVQLAAQEAKAWARIGDRRQTEVALDRGRRQLERMPYPTNLDNHFVVDPSKFDFYAMDCYRILGENDLASTYAEEVLRVGIDYSGRDRSKMRNTEARITLGVVAARQGDVDEAVSYGHRALDTDRISVPSLLMVSHDLETALSSHRGNPEVAEYCTRLAEYRRAS